MTLTTTALAAPKGGGAATRLIVAASLGNALESYYIMLTAFLSFAALIALRLRDKSL